MSSDSGLMELVDKISNNIENRLFTGTIDTALNEKMIGFKLLAKSSEKTAYCLTYAGLGNYSDIEVEAINMFRTFLIRL